MPKYFFHITQDGATNPDTAGIDLTDVKRAWSEAVVTCGEILRDLDGEFDSEWRMDVEDDQGPVFNIRVESKYLR